MGLADLVRPEETVAVTISEYRELVKAKSKKNAEAEGTIDSLTQRNAQLFDQVKALEERYNSLLESTTVAGTMLIKSPEKGERADGNKEDH